MADRLSLPFLAMTVILSGLIGQFSATYLHREQGFFRFFLLLHLFAFGSLLAFAAGSFDLLAAGWEIVGITSVLLIAFFQLSPGSGGERPPRLCRLSRLRYRIAGGNLRDASLGGNGVFCWRLSGAHGSASGHRLPSAAVGGFGKGRAGSLLRMASARHGRSYPIQRHLLRRHLDPRGRLSAAPRAADVRAIQAGVRAGDPDRSSDGDPRHHRRPRQCGRQDVARIRLLDPGRRSVRGNRDRMDRRRCRPHPRARHGSHHAVSTRAIHAPRLSPDALRHWRRDHARRKTLRGSASRRRAVVALPLGLRPRPSRHHPRPLGDYPLLRSLRSFSPAWITSECPGPWPPKSGDVLRPILLMRGGD